MGKHEGFWNFRVTRSPGHYSFYIGFGWVLLFILLLLLIGRV